MKAFFRSVLRGAIIAGLWSAGAHLAILTCALTPGCMMAVGGAAAPFPIVGIIGTIIGLPAAVSDLFFMVAGERYAYETYIAAIILSSVLWVLLGAITGGMFHAVRGLVRAVRRKIGAKKNSP